MQYWLFCISLPSELSIEACAFHTRDGWQMLIKCFTVVYSKHMLDKDTTCWVRMKEGSILMIWFCSNFNFIVNLFSTVSSIDWIKSIHFLWHIILFYSSVSTSVKIFKAITLFWEVVFWNSNHDFHVKTTRFFAKNNSLNFRSIKMWKGGSFNAPINCRWLWMRCGTHCCH